MKRFFALSRTPHGILDLATPAFCALLWLGSFPSIETLSLALATAFAGYTAIYALNDLVGFQNDQKAFAGQRSSSGYSVEATNFHHPLAQGILSMRSGVYWMAFWFTLAVVGAYLLNPIIVLILCVGGALEFIYCKLLKVTYLRVLVSGVVKACGPIAAVFVVTSSPSLYLLSFLFFWVFFWEIGGQNVPADWNDVEEDKRVFAKTIPVKFGPNVSSLIVLAALLLTTTISCFLPLISPLNLGVPYIISALLIGYYFLLHPAIYLYKTKDSLFAAKLFDKASYYPLAMLILVVGFVVFEWL